MSSGLNGRVHHEKRAGMTTLGAVSMHCSHDVTSNLRKYRQFIDEAADRGAPDVSEQMRYFRAVAEPIALADRRRECYGILAESTS